MNLYSLRQNILNLPNIITVNRSMLVFHHLNNSLSAVFDNLFKPFKEQHGRNTGEQGDTF